MALKLVVGPPNSGRAGHVLNGFLQTGSERPVLVVPTTDHVGRFERELVAKNGAVLGGSVLVFSRLFGEIAAATGAGAPPELSDSQRLRVVRETVRRAKLGILSASARRPGFATALDALIGELEAGCQEPRSVAAIAGDMDDGAYLGELADLFRIYTEVRAELSRGDAHLTARLATDALAADPDAWEGRPVFVYGFDQMTREQLILIERLKEACEVTVALTWEDRAALARPATLLQDLRELGADEEELLTASGKHTDSPLLRHLERHIFEAGERPRQPYDDGLKLLEAAGERAEAEQIGGEVARLLADGTRPEEIAIVLRDPEHSGRLYQLVLEGYDIPVAVDATLPFVQTITGRGIVGLLRAALAEGDASDYLAFLRARRRHRGADWIERQVRSNRLHSAAEAIEADRNKDGEIPWQVTELRDAAKEGALPRAVERILANTAEYPFEQQGELHRREDRLELAAVGAARELLAGLEELSELAAGPADVIAALEDLKVPVGEANPEGRVRVLDPYRVRANFFKHVFVASLQQGEFPRAYGSDPFLSDEQRGALRLPARTEPEAEERYLFHSCVSRPKVCLHLAFRTLTDDGVAAERSPFLDEVRALIEPAPVPDEPDELERSITKTRGPADVVFAPRDAPSTRELARAVAARNKPVRAELPGPLGEGPAVAILGEKKLFGASTLEAYGECSYRWFVDRELNPRTLDPDADPLQQGTVVHAVLERLYREPPAEGGIPTPKTLTVWRERAAELLEEVAAEKGLAPRDAATRAGFERMAGLLAAFLGREAETDPKLRPDPTLLEASFGDEEDTLAALELVGGGLHGQIDRVDVAQADGERYGLVRDYKLSSKVTTGVQLPKQAKLQLQLYSLAVERLLNLRPLGGLYMPLAATSELRGRGLLNGEEAELLDGLDTVKDDRISAEEFAQALAEAEAEANRIIAAIQAGHIDRDPLEDECPRYCTFQSICRRERDVPELEDPAEDEVAE